MISFNGRHECLVVKKSLYGKKYKSIKVSVICFDEELWINQLGSKCDPVIIVDQPTHEIKNT